MTIEVKQNLKNSTGTLSVQQIDENFLNFQLKKKKEEFEIEMYIFKEQELKELLDRQEAIYKAIELSSNKPTSALDLVKKLMGKITSVNMDLAKAGLK